MIQDEVHCLKIVQEARVRGGDALGYMAGNRRLLRGEVSAIDEPAQPFGGFDVAVTDAAEQYPELESGRDRMHGGCDRAHVTEPPGCLVELAPEKRRPVFGNTRRILHPKSLICQDRT